MSIRYRFVVDSVIVGVSNGWTLEETANGRNVLAFTIPSIDASNRPALDDEVILQEEHTIAYSYHIDFAPTMGIVTDDPHGYVTGETIIIDSHGNPDANGTWTVTVLDENRFTIPVYSLVGESGIGGHAYRRLFGGRINKPSESGLADGGVAIATRVEAIDYNSVVERRYINEVLAAGTLKSMLTTIRTNYLAADGVILHPDQVDGPTLDAIPLEYTLCQKALDDTFTVLTGFLWDIDEYNRLVMFNPSTRAAPFNAVESIIHGDVTVAPSRTNYFNRIVLRYNAEARRAYGYLSVPENFSEGETVTLGSQTYTFRASLSTGGDVLLELTRDDSLRNLIQAINHESGAGSLYHSDTNENSSAEAFLQSEGMMKAFAITPGEAGNSIEVNETSESVWHTEGGVSFPIATLVLGADRALTNVVIRQDLPEQLAHGVWETVIETDTISGDIAASLADAFLQVHLPVPRIVEYPTLRTGLRPGQVQTINFAKRNINNTFLITDVESTHLEMGHVLHRVTAIESVLSPPGALLRSGDRWRDLYRKWSGETGGGQTFGSVGGGSVIVVPGIIYWLGGNDTEWQQTTAGVYVAAGSVQAHIDTAVRGAAFGTCYVRLRARAGSVTARLKNASTGAIVGTSLPVTNTAFETTVFNIQLTPGAYYYEIQLTSSISDTDIQLGSAFLE